MPLPEKTYRIASLANFLLTGFHGSPFNGGLMWLTDWGMWSEVCEQAAYKMFELMRQPYDESRPLIEAPAHLFTREEKVAATGYTGQETPVRGQALGGNAQYSTDQGSVDTPRTAWLESRARSMSE